MERRSELVSSALGLGVGVIAAYVAYRVSAPPSDFAGLFSVIVGVLTILILEPKYVWLALLDRQQENGTGHTGLQQRRVRSLQEVVHSFARRS